MPGKKRLQEQKVNSLKSCRQMKSCVFMDKMANCSCKIKTNYPDVPFET